MLICPARAGSKLFREIYRCVFIGKWYTIDIIAHTPHLFNYVRNSSYDRYTIRYESAR